MDHKKTKRTSSFGCQLAKTFQPWPRFSRLDPPEWNTKTGKQVLVTQKYKITLIQVKVKFIEPWAQHLTNTLGGVGWQESIHFSRWNWLWFWTCFKWFCIDCGSKFPWLWYDFILVFESELGLILIVMGPDLVWIWYNIALDFDSRFEILDEVWTLAPEEDPGCWHKPFARIKQLTKPQIKDQLQAMFTKVLPNN